MACDPQSILDAMGCGFCGVSEDDLAIGQTGLFCVMAGGSPPTTGYVLGDPNADFAFGDPGSGIIFGVPN